jgi:hypothetical protein
MSRPRPRLLARLDGRRGDLEADLARLLAIRAGDAPAAPELGLPTLAPWMADTAAVRAVQEAIAGSLRRGEPRLAAAAVEAGGGLRFAIAADAVSATVAIAGDGRPEVRR